MSGIVSSGLSCTQRSTVFATSDAGAWMLLANWRMGPATSSGYALSESMARCSKPAPVAGATLDWTAAL